jgi:SRSO17 transposase
MSGASVETVLELWVSSLRDAKARIRPLFTQERVADSAGLFLDGLLGPERRKTGWMRAEAAGDPGPWRQQAILGRGRWDADALRDIVRGYALETLADPDAVLVIDETGFLKQGKASCGVGRQYTGSAGKITNCQIGVFAAYVSRHGHAFIDRALFAEGVDERPHASGGGACAAGGRLRDQASDGHGDDRARDRCKRAIPMGCRRQRLRRR